MTRGQLGAGMKATALLLSHTAGATGAESPDVRKLAIAPQEGARGVPTNAPLRG
jgi:hypothetical protein